MSRTVFRMLATAAAGVLIPFLACFFLLHAIPGDPAERLDSPAIPAEQAARTRGALGLDLPLGRQLLRTAGSYARGDLGNSFRWRRPVGELIAESLPYTAVLSASALALAYALGLGLAIVLVGASRRARDGVERALLVLAVVPRFWFGLLLVLSFHGVLSWLPASHAFEPGGGGLRDLLRHLVLPTLTLGLPAAAVVARYQIASMKRWLDAPHVRAARAAGGGGWRLVRRQVLRPALSPTLAMLGLDLPALVSGALVVEIVFSWPGLGRLTTEAVLGLDYPLALAATVLTSSTVLAGRWLSEALARRVDPRLASLRPEAGG